MTTEHMPRSSWTSAPYPDGATLLDPDEVDGVAVHWNGPKVSDAAARGELAGVKALLEGDRRFHVSTRGWSDIAYNVAVDNAGRIWDLRGIARRSAANGDTGPNRRYVAVLAVIGEGQKPSAKMLEALRDVVELVRKRYPKAKAIRTHNQVRPEPTACPGPDLTAAVNGGQLEPRSAARQANPEHDDRLLLERRPWPFSTSDRLEIGTSGKTHGALNRWLGYGGTTLTAKTIAGAVRALRAHGFTAAANRVEADQSIGRGAYDALRQLALDGANPYDKD